MVTANKQCDSRSSIQVGNPTGYPETITRLDQELLPNKISRQTMEGGHVYVILLGNILDLVFCYLNIIQIHLQVISYKIVRIIVHDYFKLLTPSNIVPKHD